MSRCKTVANFILGEPIGHGEFSTVYEARITGDALPLSAPRATSLTPATDFSLNQGDITSVITNVKESKTPGKTESNQERHVFPYAVKVLNKVQLAHLGMMESCQHEIRAIQAIQPCKYIVAIYAMIESKRNYYFVMKKMSGGTLLDHVSSGSPNSNGPPIDLTSIIRYTRHILKAVCALHQCRVVHRDIKLENLLLDQDRDRVKLADFTFARFVPSNSTQRMFRPCGSPGYVAPEVCQRFILTRIKHTGKQGPTTCEVDPEGGYNGFLADRWSCGITVYALATGSIPCSVDPSSEMECGAAAPLEHLTSTLPSHRSSKHDALWEALKGWFCRMLVPPVEDLDPPVSNDSHIGKSVPPLPECKSPAPCVCPAMLHFIEHPNQYPSWLKERVLHDACTLTNNRFDQLTEHTLRSGRYPLLNPHLLDIVCALITLAPESRTPPDILLRRHVSWLRADSRVRNGSTSGTNSKNRTEVNRKCCTIFSEGLPTNESLPTSSLLPPSRPVLGSFSAVCRIRTEALEGKVLSNNNNNSDNNTHDDELSRHSNSNHELPHVTPHHSLIHPRIFHQNCDQGMETPLSPYPAHVLFPSYPTSGMQERFDPNAALFVQQDEDAKCRSFSSLSSSLISNSYIGPESPPQMRSAQSVNLDISGIKSPASPEIPGILTPDYQFNRKGRDKASKDANSESHHVSLCSSRSSNSNTIESSGTDEEAICNASGKDTCSSSAVRSSLFPLMNQDNPHSEPKPEAWGLDDNSLPSGSSSTSWWRYKPSISSFVRVPFRGNRNCEGSRTKEDPSLQSLSCNTKAVFDEKRLLPMNQCRSFQLPPIQINEEPIPALQWLSDAVQFSIICMALTIWVMLAFFFDIRRLPRPLRSVHIPCPPPMTNTNKKKE